MGQEHIQYTAQEFQQGIWITVKQGIDRDSVVYWTHSRATESNAPPMRVIQKKWASESLVVNIVYRSWNPQDWPTDYRLRMWWNVIRMQEMVENEQALDVGWEDDEAPAFISNDDDDLEGERRQ